MAAVIIHSHLEPKKINSLLPLFPLLFAMKWVLFIVRYFPLRVSVQFSRSVVSNSLWPHELQHTRPPCGRRQWHPTPVLLPGKSYGQRSLVGCRPWGREESDTTEWLHFHFSLSCIGEGHGNPLQCSCLENPRDGGAWWATVYGVAQSRTRLKWLSSKMGKGLE